jgi:hypothetical protein
MKITFALAIAWLAASEAFAGTISINVTHRAELSGGELQAVVSISNEGDETAHAVTPVLRFRGAETRGATQAKLPPKQPVEASLAVPAAALADGHWSYEIVVEYADANLYPFQALSVGMLAVGSPPGPKVAVPALASPVLATTAELPVHVKNLSETERRVTVKVLAPEAIEQKHASEEVVLGPWAELEIPVELTNRTALPGSRYPLFVTVEYEDGPVHQTLVAQTSVEIRPADAWLGPRGRYLWIAAGIFGALFAGLLVYRLVKR